MKPYSTLAADGKIPDALRNSPRWCTWRLQPNPGGRPTKVPSIRTNDPTAWRRYEDVAHVRCWSEEGRGFCMFGGVTGRAPDGSTVYLGLLDRDASRDPETGELDPQAVELIEACGRSYTEVSPSGTGIRIAVWVRKLTPLKGKVTLPIPAAPNTRGKRPELQLFLRAGYCAMTGNRIEGTSESIAVIDDLTFLHRYGMQAEPNAKNGQALPTGTGEAPSLDDITARVLQAKHGRALIAAEWKAVLPDKSASEAFHVLEQLALEAAHGHAEQAVRWLLGATAWGRGDVEDSAEPEKYTRFRWVAADMARTAAKGGSNGDAVELFEPLTGGEASAAAPTANGNVARVFEQLAHDGPLVRLPTGIASLDEMTGGGFVLGSRVYCTGAPNAGKTALAVQILDRYVRMGVPGAILAVDEEPCDVLTRLAQRAGVSRREMEERSPATLARARGHMEGLPLLMFDGETSIEAAAVALHRLAVDRSPGVDRPPCVLVIDSVQVAKAHGEDGDGSLYTLVTKRVAAIRRAASRYRMLVIVTSEMNRGAYKSKKVDEQTTDMASAKESGAIEFSARVLLALRSVPGSSDVVELRVAKNKHGRDHREDEDGIMLRVDRERQQLVEDTEFAANLDELREEQATMSVIHDAAIVAAKLAAVPMGRNEIAKAVSGEMTERRFNAAREFLNRTGALKETPGPNRRKIMSVEMAELPISILELLPSKPGEAPGS